MKKIDRQNYKTHHNVRRRKNPPDYKLLDQLTIQKKPGTGYNVGTIVYIVKYDDEKIATAYYDPNEKYVISVEVYEDKFKRRGVATFLHDYIERDQNIILKPSTDLLLEGELFWEARLKRSR